MSRRLLLRLLPFGMLMTRPAAARPAADAEPAHLLKLGDRDVGVRRHHSTTPGHLYVNLHENEATSIDAARAAVDRFGGELYWLNADGERLITFGLERRRYRIDPNRMFSEVGIEKNLRLYGASSRAAVAEVSRLAKGLVSALGLLQRRLIVAVHNNTAGGFSVLSYKAGAAEHPDAAEVSISPARDPDDFFVVTERTLYDYLKGLGYNAVLQANDRVRDNGSLAVWAGRNRVMYVNVEAQFGHLEQQIDMLAALQAWPPKG